MTKTAEIDLKVQIISNDSEEFMRFLLAWSEDIENFFPDFSIYDTTFATIYLLKINSEPAGLFVYQEKGEELHIDIDYLIPKFRDIGVGNEFFNQNLNDFKLQGYELLISTTDNKQHQAYLQSLGFKRSKMHDSRFELLIQ